MLISEDEARNTVEREHMFIVKPPETLWERGLEYEGKSLPEGFRSRAIRTHNGWTRTASRSSSRRLNSCFRKGSWKDNFALGSILAAEDGTSTWIYEVVITGASGLLGINLAMGSLKAHEVVGVDRGKLKSAPSMSSGRI